MQDCIFCKIINNQLPSYKVYEDKNTLAFLDIAPVSRGHILVTCKKHYKNFEEITEDELCRLIIIVKKMGKILKNNLGVVGYNVCVNNDFIAGQIIPHIHFHIIPREKGDKLKLWQQGKYQKGEAERIVKKIRI